MRVDRIVKMKNSMETWAAILLGIVLLLSITNEFVSKKNSNFRKTNSTGFRLSKTYGETNARWLEVNQMLKRNLAAALRGSGIKLSRNLGNLIKKNLLKRNGEIGKVKLLENSGSMIMAKHGKI